MSALLHHITIDLLKRSYLSLERDSPNSGARADIPGPPLWAKSDITPTLGATLRLALGRKCIVAALRFSVFRRAQAAIHAQSATPHIIRKKSLGDS
jgi:hypothetical protein